MDLLYRKDGWKHKTPMRFVLLFY